MRRHLLVLALFAGIAVAYTWPLVTHLSTHTGPDAGDPTLNASVLWWNAITVPFTPAWWNQPWFYPATGVTAFTENLLGLWPIATPLYWLTRDPIVTYNLTLLLTWPLSAFAMYWLVQRLTSGRADAALVAGLAFGFTPYRVSAELGHLQSLAVFWLPIALGAAHAYLDTQRPRWLVVFAIAWVLQSLANGYYMLFGAVLIALWLAYFGSTPRTWRAALNVVVAWMVANVALAPVIVGYHLIHERYGLHRTFDEARAFSAQADSWLHVSGLVRAWRDVLPGGKDLMFPGLMVIVIVAAGVVFALSRSKTGVVATRARSALQWTLAIVAMMSGAAVVAWLGFGTWSIRLGGLELFRMTSPSRALALLGLCSVALLFIAPVRDALANRRPIIFHGVAAVLMALLACGPVVTVRNQVLLDSAPYRWLMALPGFDELRVPSRFWMMGALCLSAAAGVAFAALVRRAGLWRQAAFAVAAVGILADGWLTAMPLKPVPAVWVEMPGSDAHLPLLELPIGPGWDNAATLRTTAHRRPVMNGVSGYDPPHYRALVDGLRAQDPQMLDAIATLGAFEVSIERSNDRDGRWLRYASAASGAVRVAENDERVIIRVPARPVQEVQLGEALPITSMQSSSGDAAVVTDHRLETDWVAFPQHDHLWLLADLGGVHQLGGVSLAMGDHAGDYPRQFAIDVSADGQHFNTAWQGSGAAATFLSAIGAPRACWIRIAIPPQSARFVRLRLTHGTPDAGWRVSELEVNGPKPGRQ